MSVIITQNEINMPTADMPVATQPDGKPTQIWWRFWFDLLTRTLQTVQATVNSAVTAAGTTQATATELLSEWNLVSTVPANSGVILDGFNVGVSTTVFNSSLATLKIYPPFGASIDQLGTNNPYSLGSGKSQIFNQLTSTVFFSTQLG